MSRRVKRVDAGAPALRVRQVRSGIGFAENQKATLRALGLGRIGRTQLLPDNPQVRGMLFKVSHLVSFTTAESGEGR